MGTTSTTTKRHTGTCVTCGNRSPVPICSATCLPGIFAVAVGERLHLTYDPAHLAPGEDREFDVVVVATNVTNSRGDLAWRGDFDVLPIDVGVAGDDWTVLQSEITDGTVAVERVREAVAS